MGGKGQLYTVTGCCEFGAGGGTSRVSTLPYQPGRKGLTALPCQTICGYIRLRRSKDIRHRLVGTSKPSAGAMTPVGTPDLARAPAQWSTPLHGFLHKLV